MNSSNLINFINQQVKVNDFANHESESRKIFEHITGFSMSEAFLCDKKFDTNEVEKIIIKRKTGMPLAYILGYEYFFGYKFAVDNSTLIPRPDSEILVQTAIENCVGNEKVVDLCSGSGCLGISIAKNIALSKLTLVDLNVQALEMSKKNAKNLDVEADFLCQDILDLEKTAKIIENADILISNPPYIEKLIFDNLEPQVKDFEPKMALTDGSDGLTFYKAIINAIQIILKKPKLILFEIGFNQADDILEITKSLNDFKSSIIKDLADRNRVIMLKN